MHLKIPESIIVDPMPFDIVKTITFVLYFTLLGLFLGYR